MKTTEILKQLDWDDIFGNTSQYENLYEFLRYNISLKNFCQGLYPRSKNKKLISTLRPNQINIFKKYAKKLWNMSRKVSGAERIRKYLAKL